MSGEDFKARTSEHDVKVEFEGHKWVVKSVDKERFNISKFAEEFNGNVTDASIDETLPYPRGKRPIHFGKPVSTAAANLKSTAK